MEYTRILSTDESYPLGLRNQATDIIYDINHQQSEELKSVSQEPTIINKDDHLMLVKCFKCKTEFFVHPLQNMNTDYVTDCELHRKDK